MAIEKMNQVPYNDFKLLEVIDPDIFDANNGALVTKIDEIVDDVNGKATTITNLTNTVNTNETDIEAKVTALTNTVNANETDIEAKVSALTATVNNNETDIEGKVTTLTNTVNANKTDIENKVTALTSTVSTNKTNIETSVSNLTNTVNTNETDIENKLTTHKTASTIDHPDASVTTAKIKDGAVTLAKLDSAIQQQAGLAVMDTRVDAIETVINENVAGTFELKTDVPVVSIDNNVNGGLNLEMTAKPLVVNLLGNDGDCEDISKWTGYHATAALDTTNKVFGSNSVKVTIGAYTSGSALTANTFPFVQNKYYLLSGYVKNGNCATGMSLSVSGQSALTQTDVSADATKFVRISKKFQWTPASGSYGVNVNAFGAEGQYGYGDGIMLIEITADEYNNLTVDQLLAKYQFVNGIQPMMGLNIKACGKNLFDKSAQIKSGYYIGGTGANEALSGAFAQDAFISIKPSTNYTLSVSQGTAALRVAFYDKDRVFISKISATAAYNTVVSPTNARYARISGDFASLDYYQFEEGTAATAYELYQCSELLIASEFAGIGTYLDKLTYKNGVARVIRNVKPKKIDGDNIFSFIYDYAGFKLVACGIANYIFDQSYCKARKYDGKILSIPSGDWTANDQGLLTDSNTYVMSIADADSGWGETFTPSAAEMAAYFNGWHMFSLESGRATPYNGTGTKVWCKITRVSDGDTIVGTTDYSTTVPTTFAGTDVKGNVFTPYKLWYALATPQEELLDTPIDGLSVYKGKTTITMQTGIVKERANIVQGNDGNYDFNYVNNHPSVPNCPQTYKVRKIIDILKNGESDIGNWVIYRADLGYTNGLERAYILKANYDPTATYEVLYEVLHEQYDSQQVDIDAEYTANLVDSHNTLVKSVAEVANEVAQKADKLQPGWIAPTLLNSWVNYGNNNTEAGYTKDEFGVVHFKGLIKSGSATQYTVLFMLPIGYRPALNRSFPVVSGSSAFGAVFVNRTGEVQILAGTNTLFSLDGISFRAEQ